jgi:hypothetical protein
MSRPSDSFEQVIGNLYHKYKHFSYYQKKKKRLFKFMVKDGIINFPVELNTNPKCLCAHPKNSWVKCEHIYYILFEHFYLSESVVKYLFKDKIFEHFAAIVLKNNNNDNDISLDDEMTIFIREFYRQEQCGICLDDMCDNKSKSEMLLYQCIKCHNSVHQRCMKGWLNRNPSRSHTDCIYCRGGDTKHPLS